MHKSAIIAGVMLAATSVQAAELGVMVQPSSATDWTGFYAGIFGGLATGPFEYGLVPVGGPSLLELTINGGGLVGGVQVGGDVQVGQFVLGAVADIAMTNHRAEIGLAAGGFDFTVTQNLAYLGTVRGRAGYAFDDVLAYMHGGLAYGRTETSVMAMGNQVATETSGDHIGYTIGAGLELQVTESVSVQTEYAFTHFGPQSIFDIGPGLGDITESLNFHSLKAGVNFRF
jgi:outer membrane immunogenic protein